MNKGLGKDFSALIPDDMLSEALAVGGNTDNVEQISITNLSPDPTQPRKHFDEEALAEMAASILQYGIVQPLIVAKNGSRYIIIAGERRYRAAQIANLLEVPAIIRSFSDQEKLEIALIENVQREDLTVLDLSAAYQRLHNEFNLGYEEIGKRVGKSPSAVNNIVRLMRLPLEAKKALHEGLIVEGHARQIVALSSQADQLELLGLILKHKWTVRQAEQFVVGKKRAQKAVESEDESKKAISLTKSETAETKALSKRLHTPVTIKHMAKGGRLIINFKDDSHLEKLVKDLLT